MHGLVYWWLMKITLIRHGQSIGNTKFGYMSGTSDPEGLTKRGRVQAIRAAYELKDEKIDVIYFSPVARAKETGKILHRYFGSAKFQGLDWLHELDHGIFEGHYWWEIIHKIPPSYRRLRHLYESKYPDGESMQMMFERVSTGLNALISSQKKDSHIIIVSHQAPLTAIRYQIIHGGPKSLKTKKEEQSFMDYLHDAKLPNAGIVKFDIDQNESLKENKLVKFKSIKDDNKNIMFYTNGILDLNDLKVSNEKTASANSAYHIKNGKEYLLKVLHSKDSKSVKRHNEVYSYLESKKIPAPKILIHDDTHSFYKNDIIIQDYVTGNSQNICLSKHPTELIQTFIEVYKSILSIHNLPIKDVKNFWKAPVDNHLKNWKPFMVYNINMTLHFIQDDLFDEKIEKDIATRLSQLKKYVLSADYVISPIHGDLAPGNIIINHLGGKCTFQRLIDFEWARLGDRLWDLAYYWGWLERVDRKIANKWHQILIEKLSKIELERLELYRILFHAWTVRDMIEYEGDDLRKTRGEKSKQILEN